MSFSGRIMHVFEGLTSSSRKASPTLTEDIRKIPVLDHTQMGAIVAILNQDGKLDYEVAIQLSRFLEREGYLETDAPLRCAGDGDTAQETFIHEFTETEVEILAIVHTNGTRAWQMTVKLNLCTDLACTLYPLVTVPALGGSNMLAAHYGTTHFSYGGFDPTNTMRLNKGDSIYVVDDVYVANDATETYVFYKVVRP